MGVHPNRRGNSRRWIMRAVEDSLRRLGTDYIDLYQVHEWDGLSPLEETLEALDTLVRSGKVRYVGSSNYSGWQLMKALGISATQSLDEDDRDDAGGAAVGVSLGVALVLFVGVFIFLPSAGTKGLDRLIGGVLGDGVWFHLLESVIRIAIFLGYLAAISLLPDIRRVFQYHGAEHKTIAAWEHGEVLEPANVDRYSTLHVRCGTNFLIMVMVLAMLVYTVGGLLVPPPDGIGFVGGVVYHVLLRVVLLPLVAGLAYEGLRLGAAKGDNVLVRALMKPGLWLQLITTKQPVPDQIEVAIRSFEAVVPPERRVGRVPRTLDSVVTLTRGGLDVHLTEAQTRFDGDPLPADGA
jgi:uncharacterized protein YqhQ